MVLREKKTSTSIGSGFVPHQLCLKLKVGCVQIATVACPNDSRENLFFTWANERQTSRDGKSQIFVSNRRD